MDRHVVQYQEFLLKWSDYGNKVKTKEGWLKRHFYRFKINLSIKKYFLTSLILRFVS